jgi:hypothetical protein
MPNDAHTFFAARTSDRRVGSRTGLLAAAVACPLMALAPVPAAVAAAPLDQGHYEGSNPEQLIGCEDPILKSSTYWGSYSVRLTDDGSATLVHDTFKYTDTYVNTDTGESFTVDGLVNLRETAATPVPQFGPSAYEYRVANAARAVVRDVDGDRVIQGAGRVTIRIVFDLETFQVLDGPEYTTTAGQHPLLDADWCEMSAALIPGPA